MPGQADIEDDGIEGRVRGQQVDRLEAIGREVHDVAIGGQQANEQPTQSRVVFDDEQVHRAERGAGS